MHLLAPWWLLLALPLGGGLILLYLLKLRRRDYTVSSVYLWEQALQDLQANAPLQKLRANLLLLIQLLILLLVIAALARPSLRVSRPGGQSMVLILDASASMQSTDIGPSRFADAKKQAHTAVEAMGAHDRMMLMAVGGATQALCPFTNDKRALHAALDALQVTDCRADFRAAMELASGLIAGRKSAEKPAITIISDGAVSAVSLPTGFDAPVHYIKVGKRAENVGIVMLDARRRLTKQGGFEGIIALRNYADSEQRVTLELALDGKLRDAREIVLPAKQQSTEVLQDLPTEGGMLSARIDSKDDLAVDNQAWLILPKAEPVHVVLATPGNLFLKTALELDPTLDVVERQTVPADLAPGTVLVADNVPPGTLGKGVHALLIGPNALAAGFPGGSVRDTATNPRIATWDRRSPALADIELSDIHIAASAIITPGDGAHPLIEAEAGPLAVVRDDPAQRIVALGWDLHKSDLPLRPAFPILIANCIDWLSGQQQRGQALNLHTGQVASLPAPAPDASMTLTRPPNAAKETIKAGSSVVTIGDLTRAGVYTVTAGDAPPQTFVANLLDSAESDIAPKEKLDIEGKGGAVAVSPGAVRTDQEFWRPLLLLALLLLCVEWWVFHRRIG